MSGIRISGLVRKRLKQARVARLATVNAQGQPHVVPICFVFAGSRFYTAIDRKPKRVGAKRLARVRNIEATGRAALVIDEYSEDWGRLWFVLVRGRAQLVRSVTERARAVWLLRQKYRQYAEGMLSEEPVVIRISPQSVTAWGRV